MFSQLMPLFIEGFFERSPALLKGLRSTSFDSGAYRGTSFTELSDGISFWHLVASIFEAEDGRIPSQGLSSDALSQLIMNMIYLMTEMMDNLNAYDAEALPVGHRSGFTLGSPFLGGMLCAINHLQSPPISAAWQKKLRSGTGSLIYTTAFIHHLGALMEIFFQWQRTGRDMSSFCQAVTITLPSPAATSCVFIFLLRDQNAVAVTGALLLIGVTGPAVCSILILLPRPTHWLRLRQTSALSNLG